VLARQQEVRADHDPLGPPLDALGKRRGDRRLREFHVSRLHDREPGLLRVLLDEVLEHRIGFRSSAAVIDDDDPGRRGVEGRGVVGGLTVVGHGGGW